VQDNRGSYERDICKNLVAYVLPSGNWFASVESWTTNAAMR
jgi:hypothetical protein